MTATGVYLLSVIVLATFVSAADDAEFAINLLSDVAPILALFGDQFARQFMSESLTWFDHLIFAMVPLGIITAIASAVRVQGSQLARAFLGRARENRAAAEIELMSSTSGEVCELFNGTSIVRAMGIPKIAQFIIFPKEYDDLEKKNKCVDQVLGSTSLDLGPEDKSCGIYSLRTAHESQVMTCEVYQSESSASVRKTFQDTWQRAPRLIRDLHVWLKRLFSRSHEKARDEETPKTPLNNTNASEKAHKRDLPPGADSALDCPPNLQLNLSSDHFHHRTLPQWQETILAAITAILLQVSLIAIAALTAYPLNPDSSSLLESKIYGFPCYVAGSILLSLGIGFCSLIIEHSTIEYSWKPKEDDAVRLVWLQQKQTVNDQAFNGYVISAGPKHRIITSSRKNDIGSHQSVGNITSQDPRNVDKTHEIFWEWLTVGAALSAAVGFTVQFMGLRGLAFPCSIAQLGATFVMALIRAAIRRRLGQIPHYRTAVAGYELDFLATQIVFFPELRTLQRPEKRNPRFEREQAPEILFQWMVSTPGFYDRASFLPQSSARNNEQEVLSHLPSDEQPSENLPTHHKNRSGIALEQATSQQLLRVREQLGNLSNWTSRSEDSAISLAQSIELFMDTFFPGPSSTLNTIKWRLKANTRTSTKHPCRQDYFQIPVQFGKQDMRWKVDIGRIDAVLSLWMAHIDARDSEARADPPSQPTSDWRRGKAGHGLSRRFYRIIGHNSNHGVVKRDLSWWIDNLVAEQLEGYEKADMDNATPAIGFSGAEDQESAAGLGVISYAPLPMILAQHLFTSFIWTVVQSLPEDCLNPESTEIQKEAQAEGTQLFNSSNFDFNETWLRLRFRHPRLTKLVRQMKLYGLGSTNDILLCMIPAFSSKMLLPNQVIFNLIPDVRSHGWVSTAACYRKLLAHITTHGLVRQDKLNVYIITSAMDFLRLALEPYNGTYMKPPSDLREELEDIVEELSSSSFSNVVQKLAPVYNHQRRQQMFKEIFQEFGKSIDVSPSLETFQKPHRVDQKFAVNALGFTKSHLQAFHLLETDDQRDTLGRSALHIAALQGLEECLDRMLSVLSDESRRNAIQAADHYGMTPLHLSSRNGTAALFKFIARDFALGDLLETKDLWGRRALHIATQFGHDEIAIKLLEFGANPDQLDHAGKSPIHYFLKRKKPKHTKSTPSRLENGVSEDEDASNTVELNEADSATFLKFSMKDTGYQYGNGQTFLHIAIQVVDERSVKALLEKEFNIEARDADSRTPLHYAILAGRTDIATSLIRGIHVNGVSICANPSAKDSRNNTALMFAAGANLTTVAQALCDALKKPEINAINDDGESALDQAHHRQMVKSLVDKGCDPWVRDSRGRTALHRAIERMKPDIALCLLGLKYPGQVQESPFDNANESLLVTACRKGVSTVVEELLEKWPEILNLPDEEYGQTPLCWACENGHSEVVQKLTQHVEVDLNKPATGYKQYTPLHFAAMEANPAILGLIVDSPAANLDQKSESGDTPLQLAIQYDFPDNARRLVLNERSSTGQKIHFMKELVPKYFNSQSSTKFYRLAWDILESLKDESLIYEFLVWLVCDHEPIGRYRDEVANSNVSALVAPLARHLQDGIWKTIQDPYDLVSLLREADFRDTLIGQDVNEQGVDQDKWCYVDYIKRFDRSGALITAFSVKKPFGVDESGKYEEPTAFICDDFHERLRVNHCHCTSRTSDSCSKVQEITVIQESVLDWEALLHSNHSIPPSESHFYFEIEILKDSESNILCIGFCGFGGPKNEMPGWFSKSWGYHGDTGELYVESGLGIIPSTDFGTWGKFGRGDTVGVCLNMKTGQGFCTRNGKKLDMGNAFEQNDDRFRFGKLYACVGFDVSKEGVGHCFKVNFDGSTRHPFKYKGPFLFD